MEPIYYTPQDIADLFQMSKRNALHWIHNKGLPAEKIGRILRVKIEVFWDWYETVRETLN